MTKEEKHQIKLARRRHNRFLKKLEKKLVWQPKSTQIFDKNKTITDIKNKKVTLKKASDIIGIEANCLLYFFRKKFYNIEDVQCKISFAYIDKVWKCKDDKTINIFFINKGYEVILEKGVLSTRPKIKEYKKPGVHFITTPVETKRSKH